MPESEDPYQNWLLSDRLQMLAFEAEQAHLPRSLIGPIWEAIDRRPSPEGYSRADV